MIISIWKNLNTTNTKKSTNKKATWGFQESACIRHKQKRSKDLNKIPKNKISRKLTITVERRAHKRVGDARLSEKLGNAASSSTQCPSDEANTFSFIFVRRSFRSEKTQKTKTEIFT